MTISRVFGILTGLLIILFLLSGLNTIPKLDQETKTSWSQVENNYQRRMDLIPNLVETVKGYANFEKETLTSVISARASATQITLKAEDITDPEKMKRFNTAQSELSSALSRLMMVSERYPDLKANQNFLSLQSQLEGTENRITVARRDYILAVQKYNTEVVTFPGRLWAWVYGAAQKPEFTASTGADKAPIVKF